MDGTFPTVVLSYGLGVDSTALLLRWIFEPDTCLCPLEELLFVTAMTGDEWPITGKLVELHLLPLLRAHRIRYVQLARAGPSQSDGVSVLDDSRCPRRLHLGGDFRLQDELRSAGTVPQVGGARLCSVKAKGWPLDTFIADATGGRRYLHAIGFEAGEAARAARDATHNTATRTGFYPLIEWGWDRADCVDYIRRRLGVEWRKSACRYCPYSLTRSGSRVQILAKYAASPETALDGLVIEQIAVSLNPTQGLIGGRRLRDLLSAEEGQGQTLRLLEQRLDEMSWAIYEVRRVLRPRNDDPTRLANASRSLRALTHNSRPAMVEELHSLAEECRLPVEADDGIPRIWLRRRAACFPTVEWFWVAAPDEPADKDGPGFSASWSSALQSSAMPDGVAR